MTFILSIHNICCPLECKYASFFEPLQKKRTAIVNGLVEPTDEEADFPSDEEEEAEDNQVENISDDIKDKVKLVKDAKDGEEDGEEENPKGIPEFWLTIFKNVEVIAENIQEADEAILTHLTDVVVMQHDKPMVSLYGLDHVENH